MYKNKYKKYNKKYINFQKGGSNIIIHIAGSQGSGKTTLGRKLQEKYGDQIIVLDLDDLNDDYQKNKDNFSNYQLYLDHVIAINNKKPLIFVGLDAEMCLGLMKDEDRDIFYDLQSNHKYYIKSSYDTLKQRFFRQLDKLDKRKELFFEQWLETPDKIQEKIFRFVDLNKWKNNNTKCDDLYKSRGYEFLDAEAIFDAVCEILNQNTT